MSHKVTITERALFQRVGRHLKLEGERLCTARIIKNGVDEYEDSNLGRYYSVDIQKGVIAATHIDLISYAAELKLLRPWEEVANDE